MRADNRGEGGILALLALAVPRDAAPRGGSLRCSRCSALFGAALLYGDGMITPAISVLSAVEGLEVATPALRALRRAGHGRDPDRAVLDPAPRHRARRRALRPGDGALVRDPRRARRARHRARPRGARRRSRPWHAVRFLAENGWHGFVVLGVGVPGRHRRRGALRRHGALRAAPDPARLVRARAARAAAQLLRAGRAAARATRARPTNPFYRLAPELGALSAGRARHRGHGDRLAGADLGRLLAHAPGDPARLLPAPRGRATPRRARAARSTSRRSTGC